MVTIPILITWDLLHILRKTEIAKLFPTLLVNNIYNHYLFNNQLNLQISIDWIAKGYVNRVFKCVFQISIKN